MINPMKTEKALPKEQIENKLSNMGGFSMKKRVTAAEYPRPIRAKNGIVL